MEISDFTPLGGKKEWSFFITLKEKIDKKCFLKKFQN